MIHIAIVEDEKDYASQSEKYLKQYEAENTESFEITFFTDGDDIVHKYRSQFDIILMDVEMKFMDGMSAAEEIRKVDLEVVIIFITNMPQHAIRGYAVEALDYVLKPVFLTLQICSSKDKFRRSTDQNQSISFLVLFILLVAVWRQ